MKLKVTPKAWEDLREIEEYIGRDNPKAAVTFVQRLIERMNELCQTPGTEVPFHGDSSYARTKYKYVCMIPG